jgi:hypothetical protein
MPEWTRSNGVTSPDSQFSTIHSPYYDYDQKLFRESSRRAV